MAFPVALQMYSLRKEASENWYATLKKVKEMGYEGVEFAGLYKHTAAEVRDMCADIGLPPISAHVPYLGWSPLECAAKSREHLKSIGN